MTILSFKKKSETRYKSTNKMQSDWYRLVQTCPICPNIPKEVRNEVKSCSVLGHFLNVYKYKKEVAYLTILSFQKKSETK